MGIGDRLQYFLWAATQVPFAEKSCPFCGSNDHRLLKRKYFVTFLYECAVCKLRYRVPKDTHEKNYSFYQSEYRVAGITTELPSPDKLAMYLAQGFIGTEKDFTYYIQLLTALGLTSGNTILDFGSSWGYGSWQFTRAGFKVYSYEISRPRAEFARESLDCFVINQVESLTEKVDCFFSAHVVEHLPDPSIIWSAARQVLKPGGMMLTFTPNGDSSREHTPNYHQLWGDVHPLLITASSAHAMGSRFGFVTQCLSSPYTVARIPAHADGPLDGPELLIVAHITQ